MFTLPNTVFAREKPTIVIGSEVIYITYSFYVKNSDVPLKDIIYIFKYDILMMIQKCVVWFQNCLI
jgi:hypothetical protein